MKGWFGSGLGHGNPIRRTKRIAAVASSTTAFAELLAANAYHLGIAAVMVGVIGTLPGLYLPWAQYVADRRGEQAAADAGRLTGLAARLAQANDPGHKRRALHPPSSRRPGAPTR